MMHGYQAEAEVEAAIEKIIGYAHRSVLDTLEEIARALGDEALIFTATVAKKFGSNCRKGTPRRLKAREAANVVSRQI